MGLDMYLTGEKFFWTNWNNPELDPKEDGFNINRKELKLGYWRKHPNLHGFIVKEFAEGNDDCQKIDLSVDDMQKIIAAIEADQLPNTEGFFFGRSYKPEDGEEYLREKLGAIEIFKKAIEWAETKEEGVSRSVDYHASW